VLSHYEDAYKAFVEIYGGDTYRKIDIYVLRHGEFSTDNPLAHGGMTDGERCYVCLDCAKGELIPHFGLLAEIGHVFNNRYLGRFRITGRNAFPYLWFDEGLTNFLKHLVGERLGYSRSSKSSLDWMLGYAKKYIESGQTWVSTWGMYRPQSVEESLQGYGMSVYIIKHIFDSYGLDSLQRFFRFTDAVRDSEYGTGNDMIVYLLGKTSGTDLVPIFNVQWKFDLKDLTEYRKNIVDAAATNLAASTANDLLREYADITSQGWSSKWLEEQIRLTQQFANGKKNMDSYRVADIAVRKMRTQVLPVIQVLGYAKSLLKAAEAENISVAAGERMFSRALLDFDEGRFLKAKEFAERANDAIRADRAIHEAKKQIEQATKDGRTEGLQKAKDMLSQAVLSCDSDSFPAAVSSAEQAIALAKASRAPSSKQSSLRSLLHQRRLYFLCAFSE